MGTPLDWKFLTHDFFFQFRVWPQGGTLIKNCFGTIKDLSIWFFGNKGIFVSQNSYRYTRSFSRFIFLLRDNQSKMCFKLTIYWPAKLFSSRITIFVTTKMWFKLTIYWVAKLKPILQNKLERQMVIFSSSWQSIKNVLQIGYI